MGDRRPPRSPRNRLMDRKPRGKQMLKSLEELHAWQKRVSESQKVVRAFVHAEMEAASANKRLVDTIVSLAEDMDSSAGGHILLLAEEHKKIAQERERWVQAMERSLLGTIEASTEESMRKISDKQKETKKALAAIRKAKHLDEVSKNEHLDILQEGVKFCQESHYYMLLQAWSSSMKTESAYFAQVNQDVLPAMTHATGQADQFGFPEEPGRKFNPDALVDASSSKQQYPGKSARIPTKRSHSGKKKHATLRPSRRTNSHRTSPEPRGAISPRKEGRRAYASSYVPGSDQPSRETHSATISRRSATEATLPGAQDVFNRPGPTKDDAPSPSGGVKAKALWAFEATKEDEMTFAKGDIIDVTSQSGNWWEGEVNGKSGKFPSNYVQVIASAEPEQKTTAAATPGGAAKSGAAAIPRVSLPPPVVDVPPSSLATPSALGLPSLPPPVLDVPLPVGAGASVMPKLSMPIPVVNLPPPHLSPAGQSTSMPLSAVAAAAAATTTGGGGGGAATLPPPATATDVGDSSATTATTPHSNGAANAQDANAQEWEEFLDENTGYYYLYNSITGETKWKT